MRANSQQWPDSLWLSTAEPANKLGMLTEDIDTDLLIVGAGYTGLSTALHGRSQFQDIVVIDQAQPGWGCSGRNGGQINPQWKSSLTHLREQYSESEFDCFIELVNSSTNIVYELIDQYSIACQRQKTGALIPARGGENVRYLKEWSNFWRAYGSDVELLDHAETSAAIGTNVYEASMSVNTGGSLQPLSYARGLLRACQAENIQVYGDTAALNVLAQGKGWVVKTPQGRISCRCLVIGTNGYTDGLWPGLSKSLIPVASMISATEPLSATYTQSTLPGRQSVAEYAGLPFYYRMDVNNRLVMGGRGTRTGGIGSLDTAHLKQAAIALFPGLAGVRWEFDWAGYVGVTHHQRPMLIRLGENAYAGLGYSGRGITMATAMGKQLIQAMAGEQTLLPIEALEVIPLHRFHRAGVVCRILYGQLKDYRSGLR